MSIPAEASRYTFDGNNSAVTPYAIPFRYDAATWLTVTRISAAGVRTALVNGTDYTLGGNGITRTGTLTTTVAIPTTEDLEVARDTPLTSELASNSPSNSYAADIETQTDHHAMVLQDLDRRIEDLDQLDIAASVTAANASMVAAAASATAAAASATTATAAAAEVEDIRDNVVRLRRYAPVPLAPAMSLMRQLERGYDAAFSVVGDSTGYNSSAWVYLLATWLKDQFATHRVEYRLGNFTTNVLDLTVLQAGPSGRRRLYAPSGATNCMFMDAREERTSPAGSEVLSFEAEISIEAGALNGSGWPSTSVILHGYTGGAAPSYVELTSFGKLGFNWRDSGGNFRGASQSTVAIPAMTADTAYRFRADLVCDNGAGTGHIVRYYRSSDSGVTWTQVGADISENYGGVATSVGVLASRSYFIGGYGGSPKSGVSWYDAVTFIGTDDGAGAVATRSAISPRRIDYYRPVAGAVTNLMTLLGSPTLYIDNISKPGASISNDLSPTGYLGTHKDALLQDRGQAFVILSSSHNDRAYTIKVWGGLLDDLKDLIAGQLCLSPGWIISTQNPQPIPNGDYYPYSHNSRAAQIMAYAAASPASYGLDINQWFNDGDLNTLLVGGTDVHPSNPAGYNHWAAGVELCFSEGQAL